MQGRVFKRGRTWSYVVDVGVTSDGRRRQRSRGGFRTKRATEEALSEVMSALAAGSYVSPTKLSFEQYLLHEWLPALRATVRPLTWESYERHCHKYLVPVLGRYPLHGLPVAAINGMYGNLMHAEPPFPDTVPLYDPADPCHASQGTRRRRALAAHRAEPGDVRRPAQGSQAGDEGVVGQ